MVILTTYTGILDYSLLYNISRTWSEGYGVDNMPNAIVSTEISALGYILVTLTLIVVFWGIASMLSKIWHSFKKPQLANSSTY